MNLSKDVKISQVLGYSAAGVVAKTSAVIDMQGFAGAVFVATLGVVTLGSAIALKAQEDIVSSMANVKDLSGAAAAFIAGASDSNKCLIVDVYRPKERFLRAVLTPATQNAEILSIVAIQYQAGCKPTQIDPTVAATALAVSPNEI